MSGLSQEHPFVTGLVHSAGGPQGLPTPEQVSDVTPRVAECCATVWLDCVCLSATHPWTCGLPCNTVEDVTVQYSGFA